MVARSTEQFAQRPCDLESQNGGGASENVRSNARSGNRPEVSRESTGQLEIVDGSAWFDSDQFDLEAKAIVVNRVQLGLMIQSTLEDRFQLKAHTEARLYIARRCEGWAEDEAVGGSDVDKPGGTDPPLLCGPRRPLRRRRLRDSEEQFDPTKMRGNDGLSVCVWGDDGRSECGTANMSMIVAQRDGGRPIIDKTDRKEPYDFTLRFSPERIAIGPTTLALLGTGLLGLAGAARRKLLH